MLLFRTLFLVVHGKFNYKKGSQVGATRTGLGRVRLIIPDITVVYIHVPLQGTDPKFSQRQ